MTPRDHISVAAPATVANLTVGFDCLGLALGAADWSGWSSGAHGTPGVTLAAIHGARRPSHGGGAERERGGCTQSVPQGARRGSWGVALTVHKAVLAGQRHRVERRFGRERRLRRGRAGRRQTSSPEELLPTGPGRRAGRQRRPARGQRGAGPALEGCASWAPDGRVDRLPPPDWHLTVVHPAGRHRDGGGARRAARRTSRMTDALQQMARLGRFVHCCHTGDAHGSRALPSRTSSRSRTASRSSPTSMKSNGHAALDAGARAGGISGSGPSSYWVSLDRRHGRGRGPGDLGRLPPRRPAQATRCIVGTIAARGAHVLSDDA